MSLSIQSRIETNVALAARTSLELGGPAKYLLVARHDDDLIEALQWSHAQSMPVAILSGGSNLVVADAGFDGLVIDLRTRGITRVDGDNAVELTAQAGEPWDGLVAHAVADGLAGIECLSGIPGRVGATPIQNVGAYGQEVSDTLVSVRVLEASTGLIHTLAADECDLAYRHSRFKAEPNRFIVLSVTYALAPGDPKPSRYAELQRALATFTAPTLTQVRDTVITLRRSKSMLIEPNDENRRSAGSFFTNPIVSNAELPRVVERALSAGVIRDASEMPTYPAYSGHTKLAAGWLVERAGVNKGMRMGAVGVSSRHALCLVHHGGGTAAELIALAQHVRAAVHACFGVMLQPEPVFLGFAQPPL